MQEDADKEISRLLEDQRKAIQKTNEDSKKAIQKINEDSRKTIQKINEDVVKEVQQFLEKSIKKQTELFSLLGIGAQRWVYATLNSKMEFLNRGVQYPSRDQHESLSFEDIKQF